MPGFLKKKKVLKTRNDIASGGMSEQLPAKNKTHVSCLEIRRANSANRSDPLSTPRGGGLI
jgi:hypothetical protein